MEKNLWLRNQDFKKVYARGKSYRNRNFILIVRPNTIPSKGRLFHYQNRKQRNKKSFKEAIAGNCPTKPKSAEKPLT